ncbi:MORN repeat-containing protein [[Clostridium] sordellii]|uniref:MORN repeat-containing protein n=2 Tax=Paraclostridium sordellii TaxID=1505 RepID=A0ABM9RMR0_PARSO|nr:MORN repeat family protein [Paeniclostridium sordellii]MDU5020844.1 hypothetical protein [Clostridiales bacterium]AUN13979.1 hypothetical protein RSJ16_06990 [Paeniclostridium sordellii]EPZ57613.1 MORN repeat family protein [[Clostridium] sordellii VPI 9048] [Paeniclostridium sordellii VPI 9048]MBS6022930.1 hypothetical protein [Paeniclostridium sordellii]MBX9180012.1 hypothetical protein [Paeniclostridium sordellii]
MNAHQKNKDLLDMYRRTIHNIEKEIKRISLFNKFASKKMINCGQEQLALENGQSITVSSKKDSSRIHTFYNGDTYIGKLVDEKMNGKGIYIFHQDKKEDLEYIGSFKDDMKDGHGMCELPNGCIYIGEWKCDLMDGIGKMVYKSEDEYLGNWKQGKKEGNGVYIWKSSGMYIGDFKNGKMDGIGTCYDENNNVIYEGEFKNNLPHGQGTYIWPDNKKYIGEFRHGKKHGQGTFYIDNEISYQGNWKFDKPSIFNRSLDEILSSIK